MPLEQPILTRDALLTRYGAGERHFTQIVLPGADLQGLAFEHLESPRACLIGANLAASHGLGAILPCGFLIRANLQDAGLRSAQLRGAYLQGANLRDANLSEANLSEANLQGANLTGAYLRETDLRAANLCGACLHTELSQAQWQGAIFDALTQFPEGFDPEATGFVAVKTLEKTAVEIHQASQLLSHYAAGERNFRGANLLRADLVLANLAGADLSRASLAEAHLEGVSLMGASLVRAKLWQADLREANLMGADLRGANFWQARLEEANLWQALYNEDTKWPVDFQPQNHGLVFENGR